MVSTSNKRIFPKVTIIRVVLFFCDMPGASLSSELELAEALSDPWTLIILDSTLIPRDSDSSSDDLYDVRRRLRFRVGATEMLGTLDAFTPALTTALIVG